MIQVSAILPVFNGESTIAAAIDSALNQNFDATEVIVVNDGSTDGTALVLRSYGSKIRVIEQSNRGVSAARNAGAAIARGEYLAFLDDDDEWLPGKLAKVVLALDRNAAATSGKSSRAAVARTLICGCWLVSRASLNTSLNLWSFAGASNSVNWLISTVPISEFTNILCGSATVSERSRSSRR